MGYFLVCGTCAACKRLCAFNPLKVPSIRVGGERRPLCEACAHTWNRLHPEAARDIAPDAYEPVPDGEFPDCEEA